MLYLRIHKKLKNMDKYSEINTSPNNEAIPNFIILLYLAKIIFQKMKIVQKEV